jgi:hypothetical protein
MRYRHCSMSRTSLSWLLYSESIRLNENDRQMQQCRRLPLKAQFLHRSDLELKLLIMSIADQKVSRCSTAVQVVTTRIRMVYIPIYLQVIETVLVCFLYITFAFAAPKDGYFINGQTSYSQVKLYSVSN